MAGYSARQSTYTTGDTIAAADTNDEFNQLLAAFNASTGHTHDGTAGDGGPVTTLRDSNGYNKVLIDNTNNHVEFYVNVSSSAVQQFRLQDGAIVPITDNDIDLGTSSLEFKDLHLDGTANIDAASIDSLSLASGASVTAINDEDNMSSDSATALATQQSIKAYVDSQVGASDTLAEILTNGNTTGGTNIDVDDNDRIRVGANPDLEIYHDSTSNQSRIFAAGSGDLRIAGTNVRLSGTAGTETMLHGTVNGAVDIYYDNSVKLSTTTSGIDVTGTVGFDSLTADTNTSGNLLIADGTNFSSVSVGSLSEISTVANDDVLLAVDTSGGGLKKITRSTLTAGLVTGSEISNVVEDTTPQLGGNLDMNGQDIVTTSNADIDLAPNGTGKVVVKGNTNPGTVVFNCESNSHGQTVKSQPHSASVTNVLTLPAGGDQEIVGTTATQTLTNKTLTSAVLNTGVSGTAVLDEDNMASDSATQLATQQSIKAYVDSQVATADTLAELSDTNISSPSSGHILVYDGTDSFDNVAVSGDVTIASNGAVTIAASAVENSMLAGSIADSKLNTISTAGKVDLAALEIDGGTDIGADLTTSDLIVVDDGAGGTNRKAALSRVVTLMTNQGFTTDDPTALAIALG